MLGDLVASREGQRLLRLGVRLLAVLIIIFAVAWAYNFARTSTLIITTTSADSQISVYRVQNNELSKNTVATGNINLSTKLGAGNYAVVVSGQTLGATKFVSLGWRRTVSAALGSPVTTPTQPVSSLAMNNLVVSNGSAYFTAADSGILSAVDTSGTVTTIDAGVAFADVKWAHAGYGVGDDSAGNMYIIKNGKATQFFVPSGTRFYAVSPNGYVYTATDAGLYAGKIGGTLQKISSLKSDTIVSMVASNNAVAILYASSTSVVGLHGNSGGSINQVFGNAAWSPDGTKLLASSSSSVTLFNANLHTLFVLPGNAASSLAWVNNSTAVYAVGNTVWKYDTATATATALTSLSGGTTITALTPDVAANRLYIISTDSLGVQTVANISLGNVPVSSAAEQLGSLFPQNFTHCTVDYLSFAKLGLFADSGNNSACQQQISAFLSSYSFTNPVVINYTQV